MGLSGDIPKIERGLGSYETDHYAILGVPLTADAKQISDGYKRVAKSLRAGFVGNSEEGEKASRLFAKLVNPAKEVLAKDKERIEYDAILQLHIRRLLNEPANQSGFLWPESESAVTVRTSKNWEEVYVTTVTRLAETQYQALDSFLQISEDISELNLTYLLLKADYINPSLQGSPVVSSPTPSTGSIRSTTIPFAVPPFSPSVSSVSFSPSPATPSEPKLAPAEVRFNQALEMIERKQYKEAVSFLGIAISSQPNEARYYLHRGIAYQKQGNVGMAKADFQQALRLDPSNQEAKDSLKALLKAASEPTTPPTKSSGQKTSQPTPGSKKAAAKPKDQGGGFFGNLFKKK